jgi:hypothetical protein
MGPGANVTAFLDSILLKLKQLPALSETAARNVAEGELRRACLEFA